MPPTMKGEGVVFGQDSRPAGSTATAGLRRNRRWAAFADSPAGAQRLGGVGVRIKIKDTQLQTTPALFYLVLNAYLCLAAS